MARMTVPDFRRRFMVLAAPGGLAGTALLAILDGPRGALAFVLTFVLVCADFLWMSLGIEKALGGGSFKRTAAGFFLAGLAFRTILLLLALYAILRFLPRESLSVILGIGGALMLLAAAGALPARGG
jgi:hypothetical protein